MKACVLLMVEVVLILPLSADCLQPQEKRSDDPSLVGIQHVLQQQASMIAKLQSELSVTKSRLDTSDRKLEAIESTLTKSVAFTAQFSVDPARVGQKATLKLDHFVTNIGGGYNPLTGIFTAPVSGVYAFFLTIMSDNTKWIEVTLINDGVHLDIAHADGTPGQSFLDQGSLLVTVHLHQGSKVWNQQQGGATSLRGGAWTVFSGFLIKAD